VELFLNVAVSFLDSPKATLPKIKGLGLKLKSTANEAGEATSIEAMG
jgi:hypothetical protein